MPSPDKSSRPRRWLSAPASVQCPQYSQFPDIVVPSSRSHAKLGSCCPAFICCLVLGSSMSARALPLISLATSVSEGLFGFVYVQEAESGPSGNLPPSFWYSSRTFRKILARISWSSLASPGVGSAAFFHTSQRAEFTNVPSFSANPAHGSRNTVVLIFFISSSVMPGDFQKSLVSSG